MHGDWKKVIGKKSLKKSHRKSHGKKVTGFGRKKVTGKLLFLENTVGKEKIGFKKQYFSYSHSVFKRLVQQKHIYSYILY